ncbi:hypothetical protein KGP36_03345 [Patescibacteria group bacterium]|nr:hypothetical protein [Patescibacteria group bacterium]
MGNLSKPQKLSIPQLADIHLNHPPTGKAIQAILEYINANVTPVQGNRVEPKKK